MLVHGGDSPFIEEPNPRFGVVISKLNDMAYYFQEKTTEFNEGTKGRLHEFTDSLNAFINEVVIPIDAHINSTGAVHGETKSTISLGLKDNFRVATLAEQIALANVDAFMTPQGVKQAIVSNTYAFEAGAYQENDVLQMAGYYMPDDYPTAPPSRPEPTRYLDSGATAGRVPILLNGDRMVFSPRQSPASFERQSLFLSGPTNVARKTQLEEILNCRNFYTGLGWNNVAGVSSAGTVGFFHPIADKSIYEFKNATGLVASESRSFLMYRGYGGVVYKGIAAAVVPGAGGQITVHHRFYRVNALETDPTMVNIVDSSYMANFDGMTGITSGPAQGTHNYNLADFITLPPGATVTIGADTHGITTALFWNAQDYEAYLFISVGVTITLPDGTSKYVTWRFVESIIPGTLRAGGMANVRVVGSRVKDVLANDLVVPAGKQWMEQGNRWNMNSPTHLPGCVLDNGEVVKARHGKYCMRVKRFTTDLKGIKAWVAGPRPYVDMKEATTETMVPARHACFTALPERIIPIKHVGAESTYLVYGLDVGTGRYRWQELTWNTAGFITTDSGNKFGIRLPDLNIRQEKLNAFPTALSCYVSSSVDGVSVNPLAFTKNNNYQGYSSFSYVNGTLTLGSVVSLSPISLMSLQASASAMLDRAAARSPIPAGIARFREPQIQVFALTANKAVFVLSDGLCHAEVGVAPWSIINGQFVLDFVPGGGVKTTIVTPAVSSLPGAYRVSASGDGVRMSFNDLMAIQTSPTGYSIALTRPFGDLYGDVSFNIPAINDAVPVITAVVTNNARLYPSGQSIDMVDEVYPAFVVPRKGVYQYDPANGALTTNCKNTANPAQVVDPFDINETGWVRVPAGAKVFINGRAYILDKDYAVKVRTVGTSYCYLIRNGDTLVAMASDTIRETSNTEILFGTSVNGVLTVSREYLVLDRHLVTATRRGTAVPCFDDDGGNGVNRFFTNRDRI
jgi:hypothetical protein